MPKIAPELTALQVGRITTEGDHHVGGVPGLLLRVAGASRVWVLRVRIDGGRRNIGLGSFPGVSLAQARNKARERRTGLDQGDVVLVTRKQAQQAKVDDLRARVTFKQAAQEMIAARRVEWKNVKHAAQWAATLETYAYPVLGDVAVADIDMPLVLRVLEPIWYTKPETASRVRGRMEAAIDYANVKYKLSMDNPARWKGHLDVLLPAKTKVRKVKHHAAVPWGQAPAAVSEIQRSPGLSGKALLVTLLTAARSQESLGMRKGEIDRARKIWVIPGERMKAGKPHTVPLTDQVLAILEGVGLDGAPDELVFKSPDPRRRGKELSEAAMLELMRGLKLDATPHGWRSTFRDWGSETTAYPNELLEMALAHTIENKAEAAYRRGDMLERRRALMQEWADYVLPRAR